MLTNWCCLLKISDLACKVNSDSVLSSKVSLILWKTGLTMRRTGVCMASIWTKMAFLDVPLFRALPFGCAGITEFTFRWIWFKVVIFFHDFPRYYSTDCILLQTTERVHIYNVTLVDNGMAIFSMIYMPPAVSHKISSKTVKVEVRHEEGQGAPLRREKSLKDK